MNRNPCPLCSESQSLEFKYSKFDDKSNAEISLVRCRKCGHYFLSEFSEEFEEDLYRYYLRYSGLPGEDVYKSLNTEGYVTWFNRISRRYNVESLLDVGCGKGDLLWALQDRVPNVKGIDLSGSAISVAKDNGLNAEVLDFFDSSIDRDRYDVISMYELIEHVSSPIEFISRSFDLLNPGGLLFITTPNFKSLDQRVLGSRWDAIHAEHISYFTVKSLLRIVRSGPFDVVSVRTDNVSEQLLRSVSRQVSMKKMKTDAEKQSLQEVTAADQSTNHSRASFRERIASSQVLRLGKVVANEMLNAARLGSTIKLLCRRR